jgi:hypothetical protein
MFPPSEQRRFQIPATWLVVAYAAVFAGFAATLDLTWPLFSPVQDAYQVDDRIQRWVLTRQDTPQAGLVVRHLHEGLYFEGGALRGLQLTAFRPRLERDCPLDVPHRHSSLIEEDDLVVAFATRTARPGTAVAVSLENPGPAGRGPIYRHVVDVAMTAGWTEARANVDFWRPHRPRSAVTPFSALVLEFKPANTFDFGIRDVRLLAVPRDAKVEVP